MTPDDVARIKAEFVQTRHSQVDLTIGGLCDALTAAWAERDAIQAHDRKWVAERDGLIERAERAEAEVESLRAYAVAMQKDLGAAEIRIRELRPPALAWVREGLIAVEQLELAEAALARIRACLRFSEEYGQGDWVSADDLRAAIEGDNQ